ncbi:sacsin N-terminal ATP-binding-like domain-containing protein [Haloglomus halophilum]|uniref:sacsin N-terminal ATP-binding-like domain-containing protein n=1 Tax=Haloglomus halophilum TaxID=2962672 RepID=UPI0020C972E5|nr:hypothetical protein [Haloglomus halophilum]
MRETSESSAPGSVPTSTDLKAVFRNHYRHFKETSGEVAYQQLQDEASIRRQYSGRVLYELLQNALDRADSTVRVRVIGGEDADHQPALVVTNDGDPLRADPEYDYQDPPETSDGKRPDFNALCTLHVSNKSPEESVGNKGVGFRSVFSLGDHVRVWSRFADEPGWWGLEMHSPISSATWKSRMETAAVGEGFRELLELPEVLLEDGEKRPSFHFPLPIYSENSPAPIAGLDDVETAVVVPIRDEHYQSLIDSIQQFESSHLLFVGLFPDRRNLDVQFETPDDAFRRGTWPETSTAEADEGWSLTHWQSPELYSLAAQAEHELSAPGAAVAWPPERGPQQRAACSRSGQIYGYLPTLVDGPFGVDLHGDFQLRTDRTGLKLDDDLVGDYNTALLEAAAELHLLKLLQHVHTKGIQAPEIEPATIDWKWVDCETAQSAGGSADETLRADLWRFLNPHSGTSAAAKVAIEHVASLLFKDAHSRTSDRYDRWAALADSYFSSRDRWPIETYNEFWRASKGWVDRFATYSDSSQNWRKTATALCNALREHGVHVAPVTERRNPGAEVEVPAVLLAPQGSTVAEGGGAQRHSETLFIRDTDTASFTLPTALREADRAVTAFEFPSAFKNRPPQPLGASRFRRWEVLAELRQLPDSLDGGRYEPLASDPEVAAEQQRGLIRFAADLYRADFGGNSNPPADVDGYKTGWRVLEGKLYPQDARRAGRSIATLFLPTENNQWAPARQLSREEIDDHRLGTLPDSIDIDDFLQFLGVAPETPADAPKLTLIEGGERGKVAPRDAPPALAAAGQGGGKRPTLGQLPATDRTHTTYTADQWRAGIRAAWDDWLAPLVAAEQAARETGEQAIRTDLLEALQTRPWYPVGTDETEARPPKVGNEGGGRIEPNRLTIVSRRQQQFPAVLWTVPRDSDDTELLEALGAIPGTDEDTLSQDGAAPAIHLLSQLRELNLDVVQRTPMARQGLISLFNRLLNTIARESADESPTTGLPLLTYAPTHESIALEERQLEWVDSDHGDAWLPTNNATRERIRRHFPDVRLITAVVGSGTISGFAPLSDRGVEVIPTVRRDEVVDKDGESTLVTEFAEVLEPAIPYLLAVAGTTHQINVDPTKAARRWRQADVQHVHDAWIEFQVELGRETRTATRFRSMYNDAFFRSQRPPAIIFDTPPGQHELPPLAEFGEPLARLLLDDDSQSAGSLFARMLGDYERARGEEGDGEGRLQRFTERKDAMSLVEPYRRLFKPLDEAEEADLRRQVTEALDELGLELRDDSMSLTKLCNLGPDDIEAPHASSSLTENRINQAFQELELSETQDSFRPQFSCKQKHLAEWHSWFDQIKDRLLPYLLHLHKSDGKEDTDQSDLAEDLEVYVRDRRCPRLAFDPEGAVVEWLKSEPIPNEELPTQEMLLDEVSEYSPLYDPVERIDSAEDLEWDQPRLADSGPSEDETGTVDTSDVASRMHAQSAVGEEAEQAALKKVTTETATCLETAQEEGRVEQAWAKLEAAIPSNGATAKSLKRGRQGWEESRDLDALADGLHISNVWDGAGYDLLGLESDGDEIMAVRYEIKALPGQTEREDTVKVHLSGNQIAVYQSVCLDKAAGTNRRYQGDWKLVGVEPDGRAVDLTVHLDGLPELIGQLQTEGFDHDGVVVFVDRSH